MRWQPRAQEMALRQAVEAHKARVIDAAVSDWLPIALCQGTLTDL